MRDVQRERQEEDGRLRTTVSDVTDGDSGGRRLRVLHLIIVLGETNGQYNEHCLPLMHDRDLAICTYFRPQLEWPKEITVFAGDGTLRGFFRALGAALDEREYDVIHAHAPHTGALLTAGLALHPGRWRLSRKLVYTVQDSYYDYKLRNKALMVPAIATFRRVVFCGHAAYDSYPRLWKQLVGKRARVVQNAADLDRVDRVATAAGRVDDATFDIVSVGRLEKVKDPLTVLSAFERGGDEQSRLTFVGAGSLQERLEREIDSSRLGGRVALAGLVPRDDVFGRCAQADLFVSASHGEGLPVAVIEAMAAGCPVVLSDIPPHREVADGADFFIPFVRTGDVDGFAREIARFRSMPPEARRTIGMEGKKLVSGRFGLPTMHAGYERIYREIL
jgi:glycosyltransferase involved in cell wall biosynthesis